jgi:hypothetical protein
VTPAAPPAGIYRVTLAAADARAAGADAHDAGWDAGAWTLVLAGNRWTLRQRGGAVDAGTLAASGAGVAFTLRSADGYAHNEFLGTLSWRGEAGTLRFAVVAFARNHDLAALLAARPWRRIR